MASKATVFYANLRSIAFALGPLARPPRNEHVTRVLSMNTAIICALAIVLGSLANLIKKAMLDRT